MTFAFVGAACLVALVIIELRIDEPILALRLLRDRSFRTINIASSMTYAGFFGMIFVLPLYLQSLRGYTAFQSGLAQSPQAVGIFLVSNLFGRRLYRTIGPRRLMVVGIALTSVITCCYSLVGLDTPLSSIAGLSFMRGLAVGMVFVSIQTAAYGTTSAVDMGRATSLFNTQRQIAYAGGIAVAATVIAARMPAAGDLAPAAEQLGAYQAGFLVVGLIMVPAAIVSWFLNDDDVAETRGLTRPNTEPPSSTRSRTRSSQPRSSQLGVERQQAHDAMVVGAEVAHEHSGDRFDVERAGGLHLLEVGPVLGAVEERLEHGEVAARQERDLVAGERFGAHPPDRRRCGTAWCRGTGRRASCPTTVGSVRRRSAGRDPTRGTPPRPAAPPTSRRCRSSGRTR